VDQGGESQGTVDVGESQGGSKTGASEEADGGVPAARYGLLVPLVLQWHWAMAVTATVAMAAVLLVCPALPGVPGAVGVPSDAGVPGAAVRLMSLVLMEVAAVQETDQWVGTVTLVTLLTLLTLVSVA